jgi:CheY-like chemotaxis protein
MTESSASSPVPEGLLCQQPDDLLAPATRTLATRILKEVLADQAAVPMELLHSPPLLAALGIDERFPILVEKVARLRAQVDGRPVEGHQQALESLFQFRVETVDAAAAHMPAMPMDGAAFAMLSKEFGPEPDERERTLLGVVVARAAERHDTLRAKAEAVLDIVSAQSEDQASRVLDPFLADYLRDPDTTLGLLGDPASRLDGLRDLAALLKGEETLASGRAPLALRLDFLVRDGKLPQSVEALTMALWAMIADPAPLVALGTGNDDLSARDIFDELLAIGELARTLKGPNGLVGGARTIKLLDDRIMSLVTGDRLTQLLEDQGTVDRLRTLFRFQKMGPGNQSRRVLGEQIVDAIEDRDFAGRIRDEIPKADDQMTCLGELAELVSQAALGEATRQRLTETLDTVQYDLIRTNHLFTELRHDRLRDIRAYMRVLDLAAVGAFVPGRCGSEARDLLGRFARHPDFLRTCLAHLQGAGDTGAAMDDLTRKLRQAGVGFRDVATSKILVVDDEESAAAYVRMVLDDMGVRDVVVARDGRDAMRRIEGREHEIDLIICDWMMPNMSGLEFLKQVRSVAPKVPFLMVTALATVETVKKAMDHDVTAYIAKPFPPEQLEEKVLVLMNRGHDPAANGLL